MRARKMYAREEKEYYTAKRMAARQSGVRGRPAPRDNDFKLPCELDQKGRVPGVDVCTLDDAIEMIREIASAD